MKFLADMGISPKSVLYLRSLGHDAVHLYEEGLERLPDSAILKKGREEERIVLTHDLDFGELMAASEAEVPSVVIFRLRNMKPQWVNEHLNELIANHTAILRKGAIVSVSEGRIRVRSLPITTGE
jgi:predicted nuclease of predicted toxin-antitoxin system